jgi:hypothetical protein
MPRSCKIMEKPAMDEEKEKQLAARLGDIIDGKPRSGDKCGPENADLLDAAEAAAAISGTLGEGPEQNPVFSDTLRARLVRETRKKAAPAASPARRRARSSAQKRVWVQFAVAASFFLFFLPTLFVLRDFHYRYRMELLEKYDKMYVPFSQQLSRENYLEKSLKPFGGNSATRTRRMAFDLHKTREDAYFFKNYALKRKGGGDR